MAVRLEVFVRLLIVLVLAGVGAITLSAQTRAPQSRVAFDVASIRANTTGSTRVSSDLSPAGRVTLTNVSVRELIRDAFRLRDVQIVGGSPEVLRQRFDIVANAVANVSPEQVREMMRTLLAERFKLATHNEKRDVDLEYTPDQQPRAGGELPPNLPPIPQDGPSIFSALQEQLGLKLRPSTAVVDLLVIDSVTTPAPD